MSDVLNYYAIAVDRQENQHQTDHVRWRKDARKAGAEQARKLGASCYGLFMQYIQHDPDGSECIEEWDMGWFTLNHRKTLNHDLDNI